MFTTQMEFHLSDYIVFLIIAIATSEAASPPQLYWNSVLPKTPMPKAVTDLLQPDFKDQKGTSVGVGNGGVNVHTRHKGRPVYVGVTPGPDPFIYSYKASETQLHDKPNIALFFLEKDLHPTKSMTLYFSKRSNSAAFLPRQVSNSIPFSSDKLPEIYHKFSVNLRSTEAEIMRNTINKCEMPEMREERKHCATSLESMIDFSISVIGKNIQAISTEVDNDNQTSMQKYTITSATKIKSGKSVVCHKQKYAYAVFYCHATRTTEVYMVSLLGADGTKAKAVAVCHSDTSAWNPKHLAFQVLKVEPGTVPVCHLLPQDHILWIQN